MWSMWNEQEKKRNKLTAITGKITEKTKNVRIRLSLRFVGFHSQGWQSSFYSVRSIEWSPKIFKCSQNLPFARFARKI